MRNSLRLKASRLHRSVPISSFHSVGGSGGTLHCTPMHCIVLQSGGTDLAWIMRDSARAVPPGLGESRPGLDVAEKLEVSTLRCDEQGGGILQCDVLVGPCIREPTNHLLVGLLGCDEQGGGTTLHCDVLVGPCNETKAERCIASLAQH